MYTDAITITTVLSESIKKFLMVFVKNWFIINLTTIKTYLNFLWYFNKV